jgi:hypothetical protein
MLETIHENTFNFRMQLQNAHNICHSVEKANTSN